MTVTRALAASLTASVLDRIEDDRLLNSANIEETIYDGLLLRNAKAVAASADVDLETYVAPQFAQVLDEAAKLVRLCLNDIGIQGQCPAPVTDQINAIYVALAWTGWKP